MNASVTSPRTQRPQGKKAFRTDVQGLRAIAVGVVLLYHAGLPFMPGGYVGVDVFFVISGFLITGLLLREMEKTGRISLSDFYARRARRILPAAVVVLMVTSALSVALLPRIEWDSIGREVIASAFNVVNWVFAASESDYLQQGASASPVQHFWSLAVEEQFYILWPLLLVLVALLTRRRNPYVGKHQRVSPQVYRRRWVVGGIFVLSLASLLFSIYYTAQNPGAAYFVTTTRVYELGIGAAVAVFADQLAAIPRRVALALGWIGVAAILYAAVTFTSETLFPGSAALVPTLGSAAVIVSGMAGRQREGIGRLLSTRPMTWVGDISYSLYLWHWPLVVIIGDLAGGLHPVLGLLVVAAAVAPAYASYRWIEKPFMSWKVVRPRYMALQAGAVGILASTVVGSVLLTAPSQATAEPVKTATVTVQDDDGSSRAVELLGAEALAVEPALGIASNFQGGHLPTAEDAAEDLSQVYADDCVVRPGEATRQPCVYGNPEARRTIALVGDSHAAHWVPALQRLVEEEDVRLEVHAKSSCPLSTEAVWIDKRKTVDEACLDWGRQVMDQLVQSQPDLVLVTNSGYQNGAGDPVSEGLSGAWTSMRDDGLDVAVLMDTPFMGIDVPGCLARNPDAVTECAVDRSVVDDRGGRASQEAALAMTDVPAIDLIDYICPGDECSPIVGGVVVYMDSNHLTATYATTLTPALREALQEQELLPST